MLPTICPPAPCSGCGVLMSWQDAGDDTFAWLDQDGRSQVPSGLPSPYDYMRDVSDRILAATTGPKRSRGPMPSDDEVNTYSVLVGNVNACGRPDIHHHDHRCPHDGAHGDDVDLPWHCGMPMWLRPSGWHCRERCGLVIPFH